MELSSSVWSTPQRLSRPLSETVAVLGNNEQTTELNLDIANHWLGVQSVNKILRALLDNTRLRTLNLSDNRLNNDTAAVLASCLKYNQSLIRIDIANNALNAPPAIMLIARGLTANYTLTSMNISGNTIGVEGCKFLAHSIRKQSSLRRLNISACQILDDGIKSLAHALQRNDTISYIDISQNHITDNGISSLADVFDVNFSLQVLILSSNHFSGQGLRTLTTRIGPKSSLRILDVSSNCLKDEGLSALAECLLSPCALEAIDCFDCRVGSNGVKDLAKTLAFNSHLMKIDLRQNPLSCEDIAILSNALKSNRCLLQLRFDEWMGASDVVNDIKTSLAANLARPERVAYLTGLLSTNMSDRMKLNNMSHDANALTDLLELLPIREHLTFDDEMKSFEMKDSISITDKDISSNDVKRKQ